MGAVVGICNHEATIVSKMNEANRTIVDEDPTLPMFRDTVLDANRD